MLIRINDTVTLITPTLQLHLAKSNFTASLWQMYLTWEITSFSYLTKTRTASMLGFIGGGLM